MKSLVYPKLKCSCKQIFYVYSVNITFIFFYFSFMEVLFKEKLDSTMIQWGRVCFMRTCSNLLIIKIILWYIKFVTQSYNTIIINLYSSWQFRKTWQVQKEWYTRLHCQHGKIFFTHCRCIILPIISVNLYINTKWHWETVSKYLLFIYS